MTLSRDILTRAFPNDPRMVGEFEELDQFLTDAQEKATALLSAAEDAAARLASLESDGNQAHSDLLDGIAALPDEAGAIEMLGGGEIAVRGIDALDDASLISRGAAISYAGKGPTTSRPTLSATMRAIYFDTTLNANGQPIFWTGNAWVKSDGSSA